MFNCNGRCKVKIAWKGNYFAHTFTYNSTKLKVNKLTHSQLKKKKVKENKITGLGDL